MIRNPIIHREVLGALRTRKAIVMQVLFLLAAALLIWRNWPAGGLQDIGGEQARTILSVLAIGELAMVALFAPAFTAASLTIESERNTLESIFTSLMKPWEIALGKIVGSLAFLVLLVLSGAAALCIPFLLGGVDWQEVLAILGVLLVTAVYLGMIGLLVSSMMHRSYRAIIVTYAVILVVFLLLAIPAWPIGGNMVTRGGPVTQAIVHAIVSLSPLEAMLSLVMPSSPYSAGAQNMPPFWVTYLFSATAVILATTAVCLHRLRRPTPPPRPREKLVVVERNGKITARSVFFLIDPRKRKKMIRWWQNPVLMKEFRTRPMLQAQWLIRAVGMCLICSILLMFLVSISITALVTESATLPTTMMMAVAVLMVVLVILIGPAVTSGTICSDLETGFWDLLRMTRVPSWRIVTGKFQASIIPLLLLVLAMVPALLILLWLADGEQRSRLLVHVPRILTVVGLTLMFVATAGMFFSSMFRRTSTATAWTYALVVLVGLVTLLVLLDREGFSERFVRGVFIVNPIAAALDAAGASSMQRLGLLQPHLKVMGAATGAMLLVTITRVFHLRRTN